MQKLTFPTKSIKSIVNADTFDQFKEILKARKLKFAQWVRLKIEEELKNQ